MTRSALPALLIALLACSKAAAPDGAGQEGATRGALVARVGDVELREEDLRRAVERDPGAAASRFDTPEARRELLDGLVRFELLAQAADRAGFTKDPDALHALKQIAVTKLVNQELGVAASPSSITRTELEREYAARQATDYTLPPAAQVRHIRVSDAKLAEQLAARARALSPQDDQGFAALAMASSEDATTRANGGDLGLVDRSSKLPNSVVEAALSLTTPGEVKGPLETERGYEILRLVLRRAAAVSPLSSVEEPLRQRMYRDRRAAALEALIARLRQQTPVEVPSPAPGK
jgi:peptidyl-prolyl cis-trans isomerase C